MDRWKGGKKAVRMDVWMMDGVLVDTFINWLLVSVLTPIDNLITPCVETLIRHGIVAMWIMSCLVLIVDGLNLDRCVLRNCNGVGVYYKNWWQWRESRNLDESKCLDLQGRQIKLITRFNRVLRETRREDIFEDKTSIATLETVETLHPS